MVAMTDPEDEPATTPDPGQADAGDYEYDEVHGSDQEPRVPGDPGGDIEPPD